MLGNVDGCFVVNKLGLADGDILVGELDGLSDGNTVDLFDGDTVGLSDGVFVGVLDGIKQRNYSDNYKEYVLIQTQY